MAVENFKYVRVQPVFLSWSLKLLMSQIITASEPEIARRSKIFSNTNRVKQIYIHKRYMQNVVTEWSAFYLL